MQLDRLKRREFITLFGGLAACPLAARAQQPAMPEIPKESGTKLRTITLEEHFRVVVFTNFGDTADRANIV